MIKPGTTLKGRYEVRERLAKGGFATVYTAWDSTFERMVAVKVVDLSEDEDGTPISGQELLREARVVANYRHPNVLDVYDFGDFEDQTYLVMPLAEGGTLFQYLRENGPLTFEQTDHYLQQMAAGLDHAHRLKVVHRDIKPQNFLLFGPDKQHLVISDFGVAKAVAQSSVASMHVTGTPRYMAPEQFMGRASYASDIYSLGMVVYHMLTGAPPFRGDQTELMYAHMHTLPPLLSSKRQDAPPGLDELMARTLAKEPSERPKSAGEFAHLFQQIIQTGRAKLSDSGTVSLTVKDPINLLEPTRPLSPQDAQPNQVATVTPPPVPVSPVPDKANADKPEPPTVILPTPTPTPVSIPTGQQPPVNLPPPPGTGGAGGNSPRRNLLPLILGGVGALVVIVGALVFLLAPRSTTTTPTATSVAVATVTLPVPTTAPVAATTTPPVATTLLAVNTTPSASTTTAGTLKVTPVTTTPVTQTPTVTTPLAVFDPKGDPNLVANLEFWLDEGQTPEESRALNDNISGFSKLYPGVKIEVKPLDAGRFVEAVKAGNAPDLVVAPADSAGGWASEGAIEPLQPLLGNDFLQNFDPLTLKTSTLAGIGYGLPYNYGNILLLYYNKKLVPSLPASFDELIKSAQSIGNGKQGLAFDRNSYVTLMPFLDAFGGSPVDSAGKVTFDSNAMASALKYFKDLSDKFKTDYNQANKLFNDGNLAYFINGDWELRNYLNNKNPNFELGVAALPPINGKAARPMLNARQYFLSKTATRDQNRLKATLLFLQFQAGPDQQRHQLADLGLVPPTKAGLQELEQKNSVWAEVIGQMKNAQLQPIYKDMPKAWGALQEGMRTVLSGSVSPEDAPKLIQKAATS